jgi:hypothetical protein
MANGLLEICRFSFVYYPVLITDIKDSLTTEDTEFIALCPPVRHEACVYIIIKCLFV